MIRNFICAKVINFAIITITWLLNEVDISPSIWLMAAHLLLTRVFSIWAYTWEKYMPSCLVALLLLFYLDTFLDYIRSGFWGLHQKWSTVLKIDSSFHVSSTALVFFNQLGKSWQPWRYIGNWEVLSDRVSLNIIPTNPICKTVESWMICLTYDFS